MVRLTCSLEHWLFVNHREIMPLIMLGHIELFDREMQEQYINWCKTDEGREYLEGGKYYTKTWEEN